MEMALYLGISGLWAVYDYDSRPYLISTHADPTSAIEAVRDHGYGKLMFMPVNLSFKDAVDIWEGRAPMPQPVSGVGMSLPLRRLEKFINEHGHEAVPNDVFEHFMSCPVLVYVNGVLNCGHRRLDLRE